MSSGCSFCGACRLRASSAAASAPVCYMRLEQMAKIATVTQPPLDLAPIPLALDLMFNWSQACSAQYRRPLSQLQDSNNGGCLFAVSAAGLLRLFDASLRLSFPPQVVLFVVAAFYNAVWLRRWVVKGAEKRMWPRLGLFCGLVCVGSVAGAVAWGSQMESNNKFYAANAPGITRQQSYSLLAASDRWYASFVICYGVEFLCLLVPKLMLLGRLADDASTLQGRATVRGDRSTAGGARGSLAQLLETSGFGEDRMSSRALLAFHRAMAALIVLCGATAMIAFDVAGAYFVQVSKLSDESAAACDRLGGDSNASLALRIAAIGITEKAYAAEAVQNVSEAAALVLISVSYVVLVASCVALFRRAELIAGHALASASFQHVIDASRDRAAAILEDTMHAAAEQRRRLLVACILVLITFPIRATFDLLQAYSSINTTYNSACGICDPCQSDAWLLYQWLTYTPEFWSIAVALSSPLPLLMSLWLITSAHARAFAIAVNVQQAGFAANCL
jgi:hypothetical protein